METHKEAFARIASQAAELGFEYCAHGLRVPLPVTRPITTFFTNYPQEWVDHYVQKGYLEIDPTVIHGMRSSEPAIWSDTFFAATPQLWLEAQSFGLRYGWAQSRRDSEGTYSMLVLARSRGPITSAELAEKEERMQWLVQTSHVAVKTCCDRSILEQQRIQLSDREMSVLRWTAEGKTSAEIAAIMGIAERTVNFHINKAVTKLGAMNKTSAAVRAAMLGLIW